MQAKIHGHEEVLDLTMVPYDLYHSDIQAIHLCSNSPFILLIENLKIHIFELSQSGQQSQEKGKEIFSKYHGNILQIYKSNLVPKDDIN